MNITDLYKAKKINHMEYRSYLLFNGSDLAAEYLKDSFEGICMEEPPLFDNESSFAWQDGRRSIWRDIKKAIQKVQYLIDNVKVDEENK